MLLRIPFDDVRDSLVEGVKDGKRTKLAMIVGVTLTNIVQAKERFQDNPNIVAFEYLDDPNTLKGLLFSDWGKPVLVVGRFPALDETADTMIASLLSNVSDVTVVIDLPADYSDLRMVDHFSKKYPSIRFIGGDLLRIEGVNYGFVSLEALPRRVPFARVPLIVSAEIPLVPVYVPSDLDSLEFSSIKVKVQRTREPKASKQPKQQREAKDKQTRESREPKEPKAPRLSPLKTKVSALFGATASQDNF